MSLYGVSRLGVLNRVTWSLPWTGVNVTPPASSAPHVRALLCQWSGSTMKKDVDTTYFAPADNLRLAWCSKVYMLLAHGQS